MMNMYERVGLVKDKNMPLLKSYDVILFFFPVLIAFIALVGHLDPFAGYGVRDIFNCRHKTGRRKTLRRGQKNFDQC